MEPTDIKRCYKAILRRAPQAAELRFWTSPYATFRTRQDLIDALIVQATEMRSIARLYLGLFQRLPETLIGLPDDGQDGLAYWVQALRTLRHKNKGLDYKKALAHTIEDWFDSAEYRARFKPQLSIYDTIQKMYCDLLGRTPMPDELAHWSEHLQGMESAGELAVALAESHECKARFNATINDALVSLARP